MQIGTSGLQGKGMKRSTLGVRRSKFETTRGLNRSQKSLLMSFLKNYLANFNKIWHTYVMVNVHCVTMIRMQKVKGQGHTRPKIDVEAWKRHHFRPSWVE